MSVLKKLGIGATVMGSGVALLGGAALGLSLGLARTAVRAESGTARPVAVVRLERGIQGAPDRVWLRGDGVFARGTHSLLFDSPGSTPHSEAQGHVRLGPVIERLGSDVLREVIQVDRGTLATGCRGRMVGWWYVSPEELGYRVEQVQYESEFGRMDAWIVHPKRKRKKRYAIHVHGRGASPAETFRGIEPLARAGITSIIMTYRNDPGQPKGVNGRYGMGISEARDVDAAIAFARDRGAERVTLVGWSMGGTASLYAANRGAHRNYIDGIVLDSPGSDWRGILRSHAAARRVPRWIADTGIALITHGIVSSGEPSGIDFDSISPETFADELSVPVLLLASPNDRFVPWAGSCLLASLRPELVQLKSMPGAGHVRLWNLDPEEWEQSVLTFVSALPRPGWRGQ